MTLTWEVLLLFFVGTVDLMLGTVILLQDFRNSTNLAYSAFSIPVAMWGFGVAFFLGLSDHATADLFARFLYFAGGSIPATFLLFSFIFNSGQSRKKYLVWFLLIDLSFFALLYFGTDLIIAGYRETAGGVKQFLYGPLRYLFDLHLWALFAIAFLSLYIKFKAAHDELKKHTLFIILGTYSVLAVAGITNVIAPIFNVYNLIWIGPSFTIVWVWIVAYAVIRHQLFNIRVIAAELIVLSLLLFLLFKIFFSVSFNDTMLNIAFFIVAAALGGFLMRSVFKEVKQREEIERLSAEKSEFMTFASHEIRNPITAMRGLASLIVDGTTGQTTPETRDAAQKILVAGHDVLNIIATYLSKSKMELGQIKYDKSRFDVGEAVSLIAEGYKPNAEQRGLTLDIKIDRSHQFTIEGDQGKVKEVIGNLIDNSMKYTKQGGITVSVERHAAFVRVVISDTGVGIPAETLPHLFKKFARADAQKVNILGTGVGLYLAKIFIEAQGGRIWAESAGKDKGSRFLLEFPAA